MNEACIGQVSWVHLHTSHFSGPLAKSNKKTLDFLFNSNICAGFWNPWSSSWVAHNGCCLHAFSTHFSWSPTRVALVKVSSVCSTLAIVWLYRRYTTCLQLGLFLSGSIFPSPGQECGTSVEVTFLPFFSFQARQRKKKKDWSKEALRCHLHSFP